MSFFPRSLAIAVFVSFAALATRAHAAAPLDVPLIVKETAGVDVADLEGYPISVVVPLPRGVYQDTDSFCVRAPSGVAVPAQFSVLSRWWSKDRSIRHVVVHFQPLVGKFDRTAPAASPGIATYRLVDDGGNVPPPSPVTVSRFDNKITVTTGTVSFRVTTGGFDLFDTLVRDSNGDGVVDRADPPIVTHDPTNGARFVDRNGNVQRDSGLAPNVVTVEEAGPLRAVLKIETPSHFLAANQSGTRLEHRFGRAVRIYAYAGKPFVQVDYQLRNSSIDSEWSWPMYFEELSLELHLNLAGSPVVKYGGDGDDVFVAPSRHTYLAQEHHDDHYRNSRGDRVPLPGFTLHDAVRGDTFGRGARAAGWIDVNDGVNAVEAAVRWFWQTWPNGLGFDGDDRNGLSVDLFPKWSSQWIQNPPRTDPALHSSGWYWLEDMQHVYKSVLYFFHAPELPDSTLSAAARIFDHPPVATIPLDWYQKTGVTLDLDGLIPNPISDPGTRLEDYGSSNRFDPTSDSTYVFNWVNFRGDPSRKVSETTGGWPMSNSAFYASGNPGDLFDAEQTAYGELNVRPQWMPGYTYDDDWARLRLAHTLGAGSWRRNPGPVAGSSHKMVADYWPGNGAGESTGRYGVRGPQHWYARDAQHAWFCHVEESYYAVPNPWVKDWYAFIYQFWEKNLIQDVISDSTPTRALAHVLGGALSAYRIGGEPGGTRSFGDLVNGWVARIHAAQSPLYGTHRRQTSESAFEVGFLCRQLMGYMREIDGADPQGWSAAFDVVSGYMEWNRLWGHFGETVAPSIGTSRGQATTMVDPQALYYWNTGKRQYWDQIQNYVGVSDGVPGLGVAGKAPDGSSNFTRAWTGDWVGRAYRHVATTPRTDSTPPAAIRDLVARRTSDGSIALEWTAPVAGDLLRYHIVWSDDKPIKATTLPTDGAATPWWAATAFGEPGLVPRSGQKQSCVIPADPSRRFYAAVFTFDAAGNMSEMSNLASTP